MANRETAWYPVPNAGDIAVTPGAATTTVVGIQTTPVSSTPPTDGQLLVDVNGVWKPETINASISVNSLPISDDYDIGVNLPLFGNGGPVSVNGA